MAYGKNVKEFIGLVESGKDFFVFDTETTGLSAVSDDIIEFSAIRYQKGESGYEEKDSLDIFINPGYPIPEKITEITGITDEKVKNAPTASEAAKAIREYLGDSPIVCGYNSVSFDNGFVNSLYRKNLGIDFEPAYHLDVMIMAKEKTPRPHKLINMAERAGVADGISFHTSIDDAKATFGVLMYLLPMYESAKVEDDTERLRINAVQRWTRSERLDRLYVNNNLNVSIYYDIPAKSWSIGGSLSEEAVIEMVHKMYNVTSDEELLSKF